MSGLAFWYAGSTIGQDQGPYDVAAAVLALALGLLFAIDGLYVLFGMGIRVWIDDARGIVVRSALSKQRVPQEKLERVEVFRSLLFGDEHVRVWRLAVAGQRRGVFLDERAKGFAVLKAEVEHRGIPVVSGRDSLFRRTVLLLKAREAGDSLTASE